MKHIGKCLDNIQGAMSRIPKEVQSEDEKEKAHRILDEVEEYENTLAEIIHRPKFKENVKQLEDSSLQELRQEGKQIEQLVKDLEHMLYELNLYIKNLRHIITHEPEQWSKKADQVVLMIDQKFGGERGELRKEFQVAVHTEEELRELVSSEKHLAKFLE